MTRKQSRVLERYFNQLIFSIEKKEAARSRASKKYWSDEVTELRAIVVALENQFLNS